MESFYHTLSKDVHILNLNQPLNGQHAGKVEKKFKELVKRGAKRIILNLENVSFIDEHGLAALVVGLKLFKDDTQNLQLVSPQPQPRLLFELTGFDRIFHITDTIFA